MSSASFTTRHGVQRCVAGFFCLAILSACSHREKPDGYKKPDGYSKHEGTVPQRCTAEWKGLVDRRLHITDPSGHGPDVGSVEWMDAVGRKSGVYNSSGHGPDPGTDEWCRAVDYKVFGRR